MSSAPADLVERLMLLWTTPLPPDDAEALEAFRELYADPVDVNGTAMPVADLVARARAVQGAYSGLHHQILDRVDAPDRIVLAFRLLGTHTGPLATPLGAVAPTGRPVDIRTIDVLTLSAGRIHRVVVAADELTALHRLGVLALADPSAPGGR